MAPKIEESVRTTEQESNQDLFNLKVFLVAAGVLGIAFLGLTWLSRGELGIGSNRQQTEELQTEVLEPEVPVSKLSQGQQILRPTSAMPLKEDGAEAMTDKAYAAAITAFENARSVDKSDPEVLIYLNNARIAEQDAHSLGVVAPIETDPVAATHILRGVAQAQDEINQAGGIQGKPLRIFLSDDRGDAALAEDIATEFSQSSEMVGVLGHHSVDTTEATADIYAAAGLPFVSTSPDGDIASNNWLPNDLPIEKALAFYMDKLNHKTVILFYDGNSAYSQAFRTNFKPALEAVQGTMTAEINLAEIPEDLATNPPEAEIFLLSPGYSPLQTATDSIEIIPNDKVDHFYRHIFGGYELFQPEILDLFGSLATGTILAVPDSVYQSAASPFSETARGLWDTSIDWKTTASYNKVNNIIASLEQDPTGQAVQAAIDSDPNKAVRIVRVQVNPEAPTGYNMLSVGTMTEDGFSPD
ncbi:MAG: ABC transporter substrate-binding protein [Cyanobacteria bacterium P01_D01_bin.56]